MTILITGFNAFGGAETNSSQLVIDALVERKREGIVTAVLPTSYRQSENQIRKLIQTHKPDRVLMFGLATKAKAILLEQVALNLNDCPAPDNDGEVRQQQRIAGDAPIGYWSSLPLNRIASIARQLGHEIDFSHDAGGFVCNHVFFTAARTLATELPDCRYGFVHLPDISGPGDKLTEVVELVEAWLADGLG